MSASGAANPDHGDSALARHAYLMASVSATCLQLGQTMWERDAQRVDTYKRHGMLPARAFFEQHPPYGTSCMMMIVLIIYRVVTRSQRPYSVMLPRMCPTPLRVFQNTSIAAPISAAFWSQLALQPAPEVAQGGSVAKEYPCILGIATWLQVLLNANVCNASHGATYIIDRCLAREHTHLAPQRFTGVFYLIPSLMHAHVLWLCTHHGHCHMPPRMLCKAMA